MKPALYIVVAVSENGVIGVKNQLPWHLPSDLKFFKQLTTGHTIIMGRKTFDSIGKALPNRQNIVITRNPKFAFDGVEVAHSLEEALDTVRLGNKAYLIGGDTMYQQGFHLADRIYLTRVHIFIESGDAFFPTLDTEQWQLTERRAGVLDEKNTIPHDFEIYDRRS
jgi:dihydrofolate reductase